MKLSEALLCSVALAAMSTASRGTIDADTLQVAAQDTAAKSPNRKVRADTTVRSPHPDRRKAPQRQPRYCPACGMG